MCPVQDVLSGFVAPERKLDLVEPQFVELPRDSSCLKPVTSPEDVGFSSKLDV